MKVLTPISIGELFDKITILSIKKNRISNDQPSLSLITHELEVLHDIAFKINPQYLITTEYIDLYLVNSHLYVIEDDIRDCEKKKLFDQVFIELARSVYVENDKRAAIKLAINKLYGSDITEVKTYKKYT
jgi:hypothetical protein